MKKELDELIDHVYKESKEIVERGKQVLPLIFLVNPDGLHTGILAPDSMQTEDQKDLFAEHIKTIAKKEQASALIFVCESWTIGQDQVQKFLANRHLYPSIESFPGRLSCVMFSVEERGCSGRMDVAIIDETGPKKSLGKLDLITHDSKTGRFANFLGTTILN